AEHSLTLASRARQLVRRAHRPLKVTALIARADPERVSAAALLSRYRRLNRHITYRVLEPGAAAGEARRLGLDPDLGGIALSMGSSVELAETATEQDLTAAVARLLRGRSATVCTTQGHGEVGLDDSTGLRLSLD